MSSAGKHQNVHSSSLLAARGARYVPSPFFVLRTPMIPFGAVLQLTDDVNNSFSGAPTHVAGAPDASNALRRLLKSKASHQLIGEAIYLSSPAFSREIETWRLRGDQDDDGEDDRIERSFLKYFLRMAGRATPFGLFASLSIGGLGSETCLTVPEHNQLQRHTRLDNELLSLLTNAVLAERGLLPSSRYRASSTIYAVAEQMRYVAEVAQDVGQRRYDLCAIDVTPHLRSVIEAATGGTTVGELLDRLREYTDDANEANQFLQALIDDSVLVSALRPTVTGPAPMEQLRHVCDELPFSPLCSILERVLTLVQDLDKKGLCAGEAAYDRVKDAIRTTGVPFKEQKIFQVDLHSEVNAPQLDPEILLSIELGLTILHRLAPQQEPGALDRFIADFRTRYGMREVALTEALDDDIGVGFAKAPGVGSNPFPFELGLELDSPNVARADARDRWLLQLWHKAVRDGSRCLSLTDHDIDQAPDSEVLPLPDAFVANATLAANSQDEIALGEYEIFVRGCSGPSGAKMFGRFCHSSERLRDAVKEHLAQQESLRPDAIFAEVVHLPQDRSGNVVCRPLFRRYEIPYAGLSGAPESFQIPASDLDLYLIGDRLHLRSRTLGREVIPSFTNAYDTLAPENLALFRFLGAIETQDVMPGVAWNWGILRDAPFVPRVVYGKIVLTLAAWRIGSNEISQVREALTRIERVAIIERLRAEWQLPRFLTLSEQDQILPLDFENPGCIDIVLYEMQHRDSLRLVEMYPHPTRLAARSAEGQFVHEVLVPFVAIRAVTNSAPRPRRDAVSDCQRLFEPGTEWLYAKLYTGYRTADKILKEVVVPLVRAALAEGLVDSWFFIRYSDPGFHLRLRVHGNPDALLSVFLPRLQNAVRRFRDRGLPIYLQLDSYDREIERYGGLQGVLVAETMFCVDSERAIDMIASLDGKDESMRWGIALVGIHELLEGFGLELADRVAMLDQLKEVLRKDLAFDERRTRQRLAALLRDQRNEVERLIEHQLSDTSASNVYGDRVNRIAKRLRDSASRGELSKSVNELIVSYIHMHVNRMLRIPKKEHELVLYDFLSRYYRSRNGRLGAPKAL